MKKLKFSIVILFSIICWVNESIASSLEAKLAADQISPEEYRIYEKVISSIMQKETERLLVIEESSAPQSFPKDFSDETIKYVKTKLPVLRPETVTNFSSRNANTFRVTNKFNLKNSYVIASADELKNIFHGVFGGWNKFYRKYPNAYGLFTFSRAGFNSNQEEALVYIASQFDGRAGNGTFYSLKKEQNEWVILNSVMIWIR